MQSPKDMLAWPRLPGRLNAEQTAAVLGFAAHDIPVLVVAKLLKPLGTPAANAVKYFASAVIQELAQDPDWLHRATRATYAYWAGQNKKRRGNNGALEDRTVLAE